MAIGTLTIGSNVDCDFLYITNTSNIPESVTNLTYEPVWGEDSVFLAKFDHNLNAGNLGAGGTPPTSWSVYRQEVGKERLDYLGDYNGKTVSILDYMAKNDTGYIYHSFARTESALSEDAKSNVVYPDWNGWTLITLDPTDDENTFVPHEIFMFQYNLEISDMNNNTTFNKLETFTRYPYIQRSNANHMSGQLKGLIGAVTGVGKYVDTVHQAEAIRALTTDTRRKILKDLKGQIFEVELSNSILFSVEQQIAFEPYYANIAWTEVASTDEIKVVMLQSDYSAEVITPGMSHNNVSNQIGNLVYTIPVSDTERLMQRIDEVEIEATGPVAHSRIVQDEDIFIDLGDATDKNDGTMAHRLGDNT